MSPTDFSSSYDEARRRFRESAAAIGADLSRHPLSIAHADSDEFTIDVATWGPEDAPTLVTSSGVHGVEGFLGSAIQCAMLKQLQGGSANELRHVAIHSINPFGFARLRRFDENNVDLNRNFLDDASQYQGAPRHYGRLNGFLNPESAPSRFEPFRLHAIGNIARYGLQALKQSIAGGQYDYPRGVFFGGKGPSQATQIVSSQCDHWIGAAKRIVHIDFHTGLGAFGDYKLLLAEASDSDECQWYVEAFGSDSVEATEGSQGTAYTSSGPMGEWLQRHFSSRDYRFVTAEFGTYGPIRVLGAIRAENRAHHHAAEDSPAYRRAKRELLECFCPKSPDWRRRVVDSGLQIIKQAVNALSS